MASEFHLLGILNGSYNIPANEILQYLTISDVNNVYNSIEIQKINFDNAHHPVHNLYFDLKDISNVSTDIHEEIINSFDDFIQINSLIDIYHQFETSDDFFEYIIGLYCHLSAVNHLQSVISIFVIHHKFDMASQLFDYLIKNEIRLRDDFPIFNCSFLAFGRDPETSGFLVDLYLKCKSTSFYNNNRHFLDLFISGILVSLSVWGHYKTIDKLLGPKKKIKITKEQFKTKCEKAFYFPLFLGLTDVMEYWYNNGILEYLESNVNDIFHLIPEQSWVWLSHPDKKAFWEKGYILSEKILYNRKLMNILIKSNSFPHSLINRAIQAALHLDNFYLFDLLIDNLPSDYIDKNMYGSPLVMYLNTFHHLNRLSPWYDYTDEDDKVLFEKDELTFEELEKRKRIRYYGRRILQINRIENCLLTFQDDICIDRLFCFKWIGSSSLNDNFDYENVINKLKIHDCLDISDVFNYPYKDFARLAKCFMNKEEFTNYLIGIRTENGIFNNITKMRSFRLCYAFHGYASIENVLFILHNSQLFENQESDLILKEDIDFNDHSLLIELLFGLYNCQIDELTKTECFQHFKHAIEESRKKRKLEGKQDIFEGLVESECLLRSDLSKEFGSNNSVISNFYVCKLLKEKYDINFIINVEFLCELLPYPSLIDELPNDCLATVITNNNGNINNGFFQTSYGKVVFWNDIDYFYSNDNINYTNSLNLMKRLFNVAKDHLPTLSIDFFSIYTFNANSMWFANNYPAQITVEISKNTSGNEGMLLKFYSILAEKQAIVDFCDSISVPKEILDLFGDDGLQLGKFNNPHMLNADHYPSLNFIKCVLRKYNELKVKVTLKTLEEYFNDPAFKEMIIKHKPQILPDWRDISMKQIEKYHEIISIMQPCIIDLDELTDSLNMWPIYVLRSNKYPNLFTLQCSEDLLNNATRYNKLHLLYAFSKLGLPANFSYDSIQTAFEEGFIGVMNWWAKSGLLDPRFKLDLDKVPEDEKMLNWANENKHLIGNVSYSSAGINNISNLFDD